MFRNWFWGENVLFEGVGYLFVGIRAYRLAGWSLARDGGRGIVGQRHTRLHASRLHASLQGWWSDDRRGSIGALGLDVVQEL